MAGPLILASASARRLELLRRVGIEVEVVAAAVDEAALPGEEASACARRLAVAKARAVAAAAAGRDSSGRFVLAADTVVEIGGVMLGKPDGAEEAAAMLRRLAGRTHRVVTGFALVGPGSELVSAVATEVDLRPLAEPEVAGYVASGEWHGKAGGYAAQGIAAGFITAVRGSFTNVVGLPLAEVIVELERAGAARADYRRGRPA